MKMLTPAKINLTLEIVRRRSDGFHELATWMLPIALYDSLEIEKASEPSFISNVDELKAGSSNLVIRAARLFAETTSIQAFYKIRLAKTIPIGAGLGGGSSDAAATLRLLNRLHDAPLSRVQLHDLAARLGSDVAFFIAGRSSWCIGRGEVMEAREFSTDFWICLLKPGFGVSTSEAYRAYAALPIERKKGGEEETEWGRLRNDLEPAVFPKYVLLPVIKDWLRQQAETLFTLMSGSGSTMFAVVRSEMDGESLLTRFRREFGTQMWTVVCQLNPL